MHPCIPFYNHCYWTGQWPNCPSDISQHMHWTQGSTCLGQEGRMHEKARIYCILVASYLLILLTSPKKNEVVSLISVSGEATRALLRVNNLPEIKQLVSERWNQDLVAIHHPPKVHALSPYNVFEYTGRSLSSALTRMFCDT